MLTPEQVTHIATLARLELAEEEKETFRRQLSAVLAYVDLLGKADTASVEPMSHTVPMRAPLREDVVTACPASTRDIALAGFPEKEGDLLKVKAVFG